MRGVNVIINEPAAFVLFDTLLERWKATPKKYPFDQPGVLVPQTLIPIELRKNKEGLANFYLYACIYMRGGITSMQAFTALIQMWHDHPTLFDPHHAQWETPEHMAAILKNYIGWDSKAAGIAWVENSRRLMRHWKGRVTNLFKGVTTYEEADRRIRNKRTQRDKKKSGIDGYGFYGFQPKMVSMLIYFIDWEKWLEKRFIYPTPADFHNFRLGFNQGIITLDYIVDEIRVTEDISRPWREVTMKYQYERHADPVELADCLWLFSLNVCGNSPLTETRGIRTNGSGMFDHKMLSHDHGMRMYLGPKYRKQLMATCLRCPISKTCTLAIPAGPYYGRRKDGMKGGILVLNERIRVEDRLGSLDPDMPSPRGDTALTQHTFGFPLSKKPKDEQNAPS